MITAFLLAATMQSCPMHAEHMKQQASHVENRHDTLGMSHEKTFHSFRLMSDGGAIELRANDAADKESIKAIRAHLKDIASAFRRADFSTPNFVHDKEPAGVPGLKEHAATIAYRYEKLSDGARVRITTSDANALAAVHEFLRFQVAEHQTADTGKVE